LRLWLFNSARSYGIATPFCKRIVKGRADLLDGLASTVRPGTVGEKDQGKLAFGVDPQRGSGEAQMPDRAFRKIPAR
jgi:hypothetical protein